MISVWTNPIVIFSSYKGAILGKLSFCARVPLRDFSIKGILECLLKGTINPLLKDEYEQWNKQKPWDSMY